MGELPETIEAQIDRLRQEVLTFVTSVDRNGPDRKERIAGYLARHADLKGQLLTRMDAAFESDIIDWIRGVA